MFSRRQKMDLLSFLLQQEILRFGSFVTKSGRVSPYFFNFGHLSSGASLYKLGGFIAEALERTDWLGTSDALFGPAYKGISLVQATAMHLWREKQIDVAYCFNRKERKGHGEGGQFIGKELTPSAKVVLVDDVLTGGTSLRESAALLQSHGVEIVGMLVVIDRCERGSGNKRASVEMSEALQVPLLSLLDFDEILDLAFDKPIAGRVWIDSECMAKIVSYRQQHS
jgi:orotate phosphoribosyltransferase